MTALEIHEVYPEDSGTYTVVAKNMGGESRVSCLITVEGNIVVIFLSLTMADCLSNISLESLCICTFDVI